MVRDKRVSKTAESIEFLIDGFQERIKSKKRLNVDPNWFYSENISERTEWNRGSGYNQAITDCLPPNEQYWYEFRDKLKELFNEKA